MNSNQKKNIIYSVVLLGALGATWLYRQNQEPSVDASFLAIQGQTMGTSYAIKYEDKQQRDLKSAVDSLLEQFNRSVNHYLPDSEITRFNRADSLRFALPYFYPVLQRSAEIARATDGAFDPTVAPLVNAWGFGPEGATLPDSLGVDSLLQLVGLDKIYFDQERVVKREPNVQLNFSAVAKGYGVDVVANYLRQQGISNLMVEIGGEVVARGTNPQGEPWRIGIDNPEQPGQTNVAVALTNQAMATSGNYLNYYKQDGQKYAHTIDPRTGYPVQHSVLSVSVIAADCMTADAYATAFMVLELEETQEILSQNPTLDAYIIYDRDGTLQTFTTPGIESSIIDL
jgi:thiamine biosynthesis lipoprotein